MADIAQARRDVAAIVRTQEQSARTTEDVTEPLAGQSHGGRVNDRRQALKIFDEQPVEQRLVAIQQGNQTDVLLQGIGLGQDAFEFQGGLLFDGKNARRQQSVEAELFAFGAGEREILVAQRIAQHLLAGRDAGGGIALCVHNLSGGFRVCRNGSSTRNTLARDRATSQSILVRPTPELRGSWRFLEVTRFVHRAAKVTRTPEESFPPPAPSQ